MFYHWFSAALKNEVVRVVRNIFTSHPFYNKVVVSGSYPFEERPTFAVIVRNQGGTPRKFSADNFLGHLESHVYLVRVDQKPGTSIEWVAEDVTNLTEAVEENLTVQVTGGNTVFQVSQPPIVGSMRNIRNIQARDVPRMVNKGDLRPARTPSSVWVRVNSVAAYVHEVDGETGQIELVVPPSLGDIVEVSYLTRKLADSGLYYFDFVEENSVEVFPLRTVKNEVVLESGDEVPATPTFSLQNTGILEGTTRLRKIVETGASTELVEPRDFTVDLDTGELTFTRDPQTGEGITASYRYYAGEMLGPFDVEPNTRTNQIIPGVVVAFGRGIQKGDKMAVGVLDERKNIVDIYGGKWDFNYSLEVRSRDPIQREEIVDLLAVSLWQGVRPVWAADGLVIDSLSMGGESEEVIDDLSGDVQYKQDIDLELISDWEVRVPFPEHISEIDTTFGGHQPSLPDDLMLRERTGLILTEAVPSVPDPQWFLTERVF